MNLAKRIIEDFRAYLPDEIKVLPRKGQGLKTLKKADALGYERLKAHLNNRNYVIVDVDNEHYRWINPLIHFQNIIPNFTVFNPVNGKSQSFWRLENPVHVQPCARGRHPYRYLRAIESSLDDQFFGDPCFARYIHRNPLYWSVDTQYIHDKRFKLADFAKVLDLNGFRAPRKLSSGKSCEVNAIAGRNNEVFNTLRFWAYSVVKKTSDFKSQIDFDNWHKQVMTRALSLNKFIDKEPMKDREVFYIAKSVAEFTYFRYNPAKYDGVTTDAFRERQAKRGAIGGKAGSKENKAKAGAIGGKVSRGGGRPSSSDLSKDELIAKVKELKAKKYSNRLIAKDLGISASTVSLYLNAEK